MRAMVFLLHLAFPPSIKKYSQDADGVAVRNVHDAKETAIALRNASECTKDTGASWISLKDMWFEDSCLNPPSVDSALDQHLLGVFREQKSNDCHRSIPMEIRINSTGT
jgi:hypothetical protein